MAVREILQPAAYVQRREWAALRHDEMPHVGWTYGQLINVLHSRQLLLRSVVVLLLVCAAPVILGTIIGLTYFRDVGYADSATLLIVGQLVHSGHIYSSINRSPYLVTLYGPFTYILLGLPYILAQAAKVDPEVPMRLVIVGAFGTCLLVIFLINRHLYRSGQTAWLSVLFALSVSSLTTWTARIRPDFMAAAFSFTSVYLFLRSDRRLYRIAAAVCAGLAVLVKQTFLAAPIAIICWHIYNRRYRDVILWTACFALTIGAGYGLTLWREPLMLEHIAALRKPIFDYRGALEIVLDAASQPVIPFAALGGILTLWNRIPERLSLLIYWLVAWVMAILTIAQAGGNINYFWEPLMASAVLAGPALWELQRKVKEAPLLVSVMIFVLLVWSFLPTVRNNLNISVRHYQYVSNYQVRRAKWESFVAIISGRKLLSTLPDVTIHGKTPELLDPFFNATLEIRGMWSSSPIVAQIDSGVYDLIVIEKGQAEGSDYYRGIPKWSDGMWGAVKRRYRRVCMLEGMEVWSPGQGSDEIVRNLLAIGCVPVTNQSYNASAPSAGRL